jgi:arginine decarboxylase
MSPLLLGNRIPRDFFITQGQGQSDITVHAGSFHLALRDAGIEMANIMTYSSILPSIAREVPRPDRIRHGCVMESIMAEASCEQDETCTAGLAFGWLYDTASQVYGGLVTEYVGSMNEGLAKEHMRAMLTELHTNGYEHLTLEGIRTITQSVTPSKRYGTAVVGLCFTSYEHPVLAA